MNYETIKIFLERNEIINNYRLNANDIYIFGDSEANIILDKINEIAIDSDFFILKTKDEVFKFRKKHIGLWKNK